MNAQSSLLDNFNSMQDEFNSSNNRIIRNVDKLFENNINDLLSSLNHLNEEYFMLDVRVLNKEFGGFKNKMKEIETTHISSCSKVFNKEKENLKQELCSFFEMKLLKGDNFKKRLSCSIKKSLDKMCDFNIMGLEERINNLVYDFKKHFEFNYINNEHCKDDFNKIIRTFKHSLVEEIRDSLVNSCGEMQNIVSRYADKAYTIVNHYRRMKR